MRRATLVLAHWSHDHDDVRALMAKIAKDDPNRLVRGLAQSTVEQR